MYKDGEFNGWFRVYLIFGLAGFLLGFLGYLATEPPEVSRRFAERWADFNARFPIFNDLGWLNKSVPVFNRTEAPTVLLLQSDAGEESRSAAFYSALEAKLKPFSPNIIRVSYDPAAGQMAAIDSATLQYRKYLLFGLQVNDGAQSGINSRLTIGAPAYLAPGVFTTLASGLPESLAQFAWEQKDTANGRMLTVQWNDDPMQSKIDALAETCLKLYQAEREGSARGYEL